jgi:hypothetical protein
MLTDGSDSPTAGGGTTARRCATAAPRESGAPPPAAAQYQLFALECAQAEHGEPYRLSM